VKENIQPVDSDKPRAIKLFKLRRVTAVSGILVMIVWFVIVMFGAVLTKSSTVTVNNRIYIEETPLLDINLGLLFMIIILLPSIFVVINAFTYYLTRKSISLYSGKNINDMTRTEVMATLKGIKNSKEVGFDPTYASEWK
jgi:Mg2+/Co2+ transporter CorB